MYRDQLLSFAFTSPFFVAIIFFHFWNQHQPNMISKKNDNAIKNDGAKLCDTERSRKFVRYRTIAQICAMQNDRANLCYNERWCDTEWFWESVRYRQSCEFVWYRTIVKYRKIVRICAMNEARGTLWISIRFFWSHMMKKNNISMSTFLRKESPYTGSKYESMHSNEPN